MRYFAYGSNMEPAQMARRAPGATLLGPGRLPGKVFSINTRGYATVIPCPDGTVEGVLWEIPPETEAHLDRYEAVASGLYVKQVVRVEGPGRSTIEALIYVASDSTPGRARPHYLRAIIRAAKLHGLTAAHIRTLESWSSLQCSAGFPALLDRV